ncbi:hypothetical protein L1S35_05185 [Flavobacterium sp. AS60]|uniref:hypothetical protein n=1 Tax=Flavobacterium anseongense TaxID=2910677 RepID=UPI001F33C7F2|nr:hypothetical protein [Flavobacterium sp. AS60]MCF6129058.1 hypothetical protein [Flavobacterium sp. AS60]
MKKQDITILSIGVLLIFISLYLFTRPAFLSSFDFSSTGQVGDTIGGISAPILNLIGAYLVYISFQAQLEANRIQAKALNDEKERARTEGIYQKYISQFEDIKKTLRELEFVVRFWADYSAETVSPNPPIVYKGINALNEYTARLVARKAGSTKYDRQNYELYSMYLNYEFMLLSLHDLIINVETRIEDSTDQEYLLSNIKLFYNSFLKVFGEKIIDSYGAEQPEMLEIVKIRDFMLSKFGV